MKLLVTGGAGYIGTQLVRDLVKSDYSVTIVDRLFFGRETIAEFIDNPNVKIIQPPTQLDINDIDKTIKVYVNEFP
jgi:UDP-glucose 4-epimerase